VVAGVTQLSGDSLIFVLRLTSTGALDPSFGDGGKLIVPRVGTAIDGAGAVRIAPDGRIVVGGFRTSSPTTTDGLVLRINP
jgi:hypothetical protein